MRRLASLETTTGKFLSLILHLLAKLSKITSTTVTIVWIEQMLWHLEILQLRLSNARLLTSLSANKHKVTVVFRIIKEI